MQTVNNQLPLQKLANNIREFTNECEKSELNSEIIDETLDSMLDVDDLEKDKCIDQILDEIETREKV